MTVRLAAVAGLGSRPVSSSPEHVLSPLSRPPLKEKQRKSFIHSFIRFLCKYSLTTCWKNSLLVPDFKKISNCGPNLWLPWKTKCVEEGS